MRTFRQIALARVSRAVSETSEILFAMCNIRKKPDVDISSGAT